MLKSKVFLYLVVSIVHPSFRPVSNERKQMLSCGILLTRETSTRHGILRMMPGSRKDTKNAYAGGLELLRHAGVNDLVCEAGCLLSILQMKEKRPWEMD